MFDWIPKQQPHRGLVVFLLVLGLSAVVIVPLSLSDGGDDEDGYGDGLVGPKPPVVTRSTPTTPPPATVTTPPPPVTTPPPTTTPTEPTPKPPIERSVGQTATDDGLQLTVNSIREVSRIKRGDYYKRDYKPPAGGKLVAVEVTFVNNTSAPIDPFCGGNSAALVDQKGRAHETIDDLYSIEGNDAVCGSAGTLAGDKATVVLAFKLKRGERIDHLDLWNGKYEPDFDGEATRVRYRPTAGAWRRRAASSRHRRPQRPLALEQDEDSHRARGQRGEQRGARADRIDGCAQQRRSHADSDRARAADPRRGLGARPVGRGLG